ncbi:hypothetical protein AGABI1DRAFT_130068 [Agaricus bisporus var. burnettii JB137-S8]|uniref:Uncharacterized protein n=1 Tax=Agaricus bisporus var. burnettii (strain JB137-S8 / ATCC MYA-4627 / FGSC 10392) TaxID=597362 RepID=K5WR05_AGABU|nr:uncharacterized protein AGABI1DRAFT_130068 [Agaricus bisporus var. burnettii JB137-S8]EKM77796.1 hypothetical protein AGABI1DRAFT_130068 [Agaricus bisporus var. burnettii JB137-S8]
MSFPTAAIMKAIYDIVLSHPLIILFLGVFTLSTIFSVLLVAVIANDPNHLASSPTDEEGGAAPWWNADAPRYSSIPMSADSRSVPASATNSPLEISREESELLLAVHREYMKDDLKRLSTFEWEERGE